MVTLFSGSPSSVSRLRGIAAGLGLLTAVLLTPALAQAQVSPELGKPQLSPPPLPPPPAGQPSAQTPPPPVPRQPPYEQPPPGAMMGYDLHMEIQQLLSALSDHRRSSEVQAIRQRNRGLIAGGAVLLSSGYLGAVIAGSFVVAQSQGSSFSRDLVTERNAGGTLFIPVLGPLISSLVFRDPLWSLNWSLVDGVAQMGGVVMIVAGVYSNRKLPAPLAGLRLGPMRTSTTTGFTLSGAF